jgi:hypothetical protein
MVNPSLLVLGLIAVVLFCALLGWRRLGRYRSMRASETARLERHVRDSATSEW